MTDCHIPQVILHGLPTNGNRTTESPQLLYKYNTCKWDMNMFGNCTTTWEVKAYDHNMWKCTIRSHFELSEQRLLQQTERKSRLCGSRLLTQGAPPQSQMWLKEVLFLWSRSLHAYLFVLSRGKSLNAYLFLWSKSVTLHAYLFLWSRVYLFMPISNCSSTIFWSNYFMGINCHMYNARL